MDRDGWYKIHRELLDKPIWVLSTPEQKVVLITLLSMVNYKENKWEWKGKQFCCKPGQLITSLESIAKECGKGVTVQNVRTALKRFEKFEFLTNESTKTGRLITIVNWGKYQGVNVQPNKASNKDLTNSQQRPNKQLTPIKEIKNIRRIKEIEQPAALPSGTDDDDEEGWMSPEEMAIFRKELRKKKDGENI